MLCWIGNILTRATYICYLSSNSIFRQYYTCTNTLEYAKDKHYKYKHEQKYMFYTSETNAQEDIFIKHNKWTNKLRKCWCCNALCNKGTITLFILGDNFFNKNVIFF